MESYIGEEGKNIDKEDMFPKLLWELCTKLYPTEDTTGVNIISGFRICGICPLSADVVLKRIPDAKKNLTTSTTHSSVFDAVIEILQNSRGVDNIIEHPENVKVPSEEDEQADEDISNDSQHRVAGNKKRSTAKSLIFVCAGYHYVIEFIEMQSIKHYIGKVKFIYPVVVDEVSDLPCVQIVEAMDVATEGRRGELEFNEEQLEQFKKILH